MDFIAFVNDVEWDRPFFKVLPKNDTGDAPGHQGGLVILKAMRPYFPTLEGTTTQERPTMDRAINAILYNGTEKVATVLTRYQYQTWSGTRSPESRLTGQLGSIRNIAQEGDVLVFQRHLSNLDLFRIILVKKTSPVFQTIQHNISSRRWGVFFDDSPVSQEDIDKLEREEQEQEFEPFRLFESESRKIETKIIR